VYYVWPSTLQNNFIFWVFEAKRAFTLPMMEGIEVDSIDKTVHF